MLAYGFRLGGAAVLVLLAGVLGIYFFSALWVRVSFGAAVLIVIGGILVLVWRMEKRDRTAREGLERI
jgi:Flp pilus assembly protein TadB